MSKFHLHMVNYSIRLGFPEKTNDINGRINICSHDIDGMHILSLIMHIGSNIDLKVPGND